MCGYDKRQPAPQRPYLITRPPSDEATRCASEYKMLQVSGQCRSAARSARHLEPQEAYRTWPKSYKGACVCLCARIRAIAVCVYSNARRRVTQTILPTYKRADATKHGHTQTRTQPQNKKRRRGEREAKGWGITSESSSVSNSARIEAETAMPETGESGRPSSQWRVRKWRVSD